jgi:hypothetical protein
MLATLSDKGRDELSQVLTSFLGNFVPDMSRNQVFLLTSVINSVISQKGMLQKLGHATPPPAAGAFEELKLVAGEG